MISVNLLVDEELLVKLKLNLNQTFTAEHLVPNIVVAQGGLETAVEPFPVDFQMPQITLDPTVESNYRCVVFQMPEDFNVVGVEAVWSNGTTIQDEEAPSFLHHQNLKHCGDGSLLKKKWMTGSFDCGSDAEVYASMPCTPVLSHDKTGLIHSPSGVHIPLVKNHYYLLEVHYDNPFEDAIENSTSGIRTW